MPPVAAAVAAPLLAPLHVTLVVELMLTCSVAGFTMLTVACAVQPFMSVSVTT